eukprot:CAMPEP_0114508564 /NCGR_PEP_ID=MMETSP0109-20121206/12681_1 /TAXON_ID=29199 /ORGANISM="Chlorarachnion reptans, Strain CCCM449" /LENGTH=432 /DNA_ID=CAMNT_0001687533 /DNA_START=84 /DNA_END=1383 /DNA_ORIENTATION=-
MAEVVAKEPADTKGDTTVAPTSADAAAVPASTAPSSTAGDSKNIPAKGKSIEAFEGENEEAGTHNGRRDTEKRSDGKRPARSRSASPNPDAKWAARERSPPRERQPIESYQGAGGGMASGATGSQAYGGSGDAAVEPPMANNGMGASSGAQICRDFTMGRCFRANCRFLHEGASAGGGAMGGQIMQPCKDWMNGKCYRGTRCRFSHEGDMMMQQQQQQQQYGAQNYFYGGAGGYGQYSQNGYYAGQYCPPVGYGGVGGYGAQAQAYNGGFGGGFGGGQRREKCRDYMYGKCSRGNMCKFMHEDAGVDMCKDFQNGKCQRGAECKFLHQSMDGSMGMSRYGGEAAGEKAPSAHPSAKTGKMESASGDKCAGTYIAVKGAVPLRQVLTHQEVKNAEIFSSEGASGVVHADFFIRKVAKVRGTHNPQFSNRARIS